MSKEINNISIFVGRLNPMTMYHRTLIEDSNIDLVFMTRTEDGNKNPMGALLKFAATSDTLMCHNLMVLECDDVMDALTKTVAFGKLIDPNKNIAITLHCGSDRARVYKRLNTYSKEIGFKDLTVVSHERKSEHHSATYLRQLAIEGKHKEFNKLCGYTGDWKKIAYGMIRKKYGCIQSKVDPSGI